MTDGYIDREVGFFPLSIGTSLALEGFLGTHPHQPPMPSGHRRINLLWVNLRTVIRNFYAAVPAEQARKVPLDTAVQVILTELDVLVGLPQQDTRRSYSVTLYVEDFTAVAWDFRHAKLRKPITERQIYFQQVEELLLTRVLAVAELPIVTVKSQPPSTPGVAAILTHHPHHLLWRFQFESLFLLESHTGKLKTYGQWYTKLKGVSPEDRLPFNRLTLQLFGDGAVFEAFPKPLREEMKQIAATRKWTAVTTPEKIKDDIRNYAGEGLRKTVYDLL